MIIDEGIKKDNSKVISSLMNIIVYGKSDIINHNNQGVKLSEPKYVLDLNPIISTILEKLQEKKDNELISLLLASSFYSIYWIKRNKKTNVFIRDKLKLGLYIGEGKNKITIFDYTHNSSIKDYNINDNLILCNMPDLALTILSYYDNNREELYKVFVSYIKQSNTGKEFQEGKRGKFFCEWYNKYIMI